MFMTRFGEVVLQIRNIWLDLGTDSDPDLDSGPVSTFPSLRNEVR